MYYYRTLLGLAMAYLALQCLFGYWHCENNFCPGDKLSDYVYEYVDDNGIELSDIIPEDQKEDFETPYERFMKQQVEAPKENRGTQKK